MWKWFMALVLLVSLCFWVTSCSYLGKRGSEEDETSGQSAEDEIGNVSNTRDGLVGDRRPVVRGRGMGKAGFGRGFGRGRAIRENVILREDELEAVEIETAGASWRPLRSLQSAMGKVLAPQTRTAIVSYAFPARVAELHVLVGDWVKKGQRLLTLQSEEVGLARSEFYKAVADLELAKANCQREQRLFDRGVGAQKNLLAAQAELKVCEANLDSAEKKLHVLGFSEEDVRRISESHQISPVIDLFAPINGKVVKHNAVLGSMIDQSTELMTIMDPSLLWVDAEIYERDISKIKIGQRVQVSVPSYPGETFAGKVSYISDMLNDETRTLTVRAEVENSSFKLKPGMFADISILLNHQTNVLVVPCEAVLDDGNDRIVFVREERGYARRTVQIGVRDNGYCEVRNGLEKGDEVVTAGNYQLKSKLYDDLLKESHLH